MIAPPPPVQTTPRVPVGLSVAAGIVGVLTAIGAAMSGFTRQLASRGVIDLYWGSAVTVTAVVLMVGAGLALAHHEAGVAVLAGSGAAMAVNVATTLTSERFDLGDFLDAFPLRGPAFVAAGGAGAVLAILGLLGLRGRGAPGLGAVSALAALGVLACHAAVFRLDDRQDGFVVRPFVGISVVVAVMIVGCFVGRAGAFATVAGAVCIAPVYTEVADFDGFPRRSAAIVALLALGGIILLSTIAGVLAGRRQDVQQFAPTGAWYPQGDPTQSVPAQPYPSGGYGTPAYGTPAFGATATAGAPAFGAPVVDDWSAGAADSTRPLPAISEATTSLGALYEPTRPEPESGSTESSWATAPTAVTPTVSPTVASGQSPAQWAPDPYGRHQMRYWDGQQWTGHVSDGGSSGTDAVS